jgi:glycerophosphoryl diester phosphodiesterase
VSRRRAAECAQAGRPFVVAHRSGNSLAEARAVARIGVPAIEADVHLFRGRLELRHLKTAGPLPLLWDRWTLANPFARRLLLAELLPSVGLATELVLDLKGWRTRLSARVAEALVPRVAAGGATTVCSRSWRLLEPFRATRGIRVVHSVGSERQLARLRRRFSGPGLEGVSIHERLVDADTARDLRAMTGTILAWPVNTTARARELAALGVTGLITDRPGDIQAAAAVTGAP